MKIRLLTLFAFAGLFLLFSQNSDALIMINDPANTTDVIVVGTIVSVFPNYDKLETEYEVSIEDIVKGKSLLSHGNYTKTLHFTSPGIDDSEIELRRTTDYKLFEEGQRALFLLYEKNDKLVHGLSVVNSFCNAEQMIQLYYVPAGLVMTQDGIDEQPYHTHEPITAQFYYFNKNLDESTIDVNIKIVDDFPDVLHEETYALNLETCQAYAMAETQFVIEKPGKFAISVDVDGGNGGGVAISGIDVIDYFQSPLKQFKSGIPTDKITCKENLASIQKYDGSPACVKSNSVSKLVTREWGTSDNWIKISNADKSIHYELENAKISYVLAFSELQKPSLPEESKETSLQIGLIQTQDGMLKITLPRNLIDSKINNLDDDFFVLLDGMETDYTETKTESKRTLEFSFTPENHFIEIIGYGYHNAELSTFDDRLSELYRQCNIDKPGSIWDESEKYCSYTTIASGVSGHTISDSNDVDLSAENILIKSDSRHTFLEQLRKTPRTESMQNFTDAARDFVVSEALGNSEVSDLLSDNQYEVRCCTFSFDRNYTLYNRYVGLVFDIPEKYMKVVVTYDLSKQQISGASTEILLEDGIIKVGEKENEN
ncbi:MAG: hypothetical protein K5798_09925 [Nitrosopumilus sp.]|uniref:hypothetical protein n=1 Tax=Nitrosopumilus sp. TaxID=2024843 RepID=UPI00242E8A98|nr:hypothetical protein [Nitrosopumilus sp.]MCV0367562.1 hypothetical protein [Nitrosopumilus sp.]